MDRHTQFTDKIFKIFTNSGFGVEQYDETTFDIIDRTIIGKAKIGSVKVLDNGDISVKLGGEQKKHSKFNSLMNNTSLKAKPTHNVATVAKMVKEMISDYKKAKKVIYKESYKKIIDNMLVEVTKPQLEDSIDAYISKVLKSNGGINANYSDILSFVSESLNIKQDECDAKFGDILAISIDYDETSYNNAIDKVFMESEIKNDFRKYLKESKIEDLENEIRSDTDFRLMRNDSSYKNADVNGKYKKIWQYIVRTYGSKFSNNDELDDICHRISEEDEDRF